MAMAFPYGVDPIGRTSTVTGVEHIQNLIELTLFTTVGERVNRPHFGANMQQLVFEPNSEALATAVQSTLLSALTQWLGDRIAVQTLTVSVRDNALIVEVQYVVLLTQERRTDTFRRAMDG